MVASFCYAIILEEFDKKIANIAVILYAFMPMTAYYGRMVAHESGCIFFILLTFYFYLKHVKSFTNKTLIGMYTSFLLGTFMGWHGYYVFGGIFLHVLLYQRNKRMILKTGFLFFLGVVSFFFMLEVLSYFSGKIGWEPILDELIVKAELRGEWIVSVEEFIDLEYYRAVKLFGMIPFFFSLLSIVI